MNCTPNAPTLSHPAPFLPFRQMKMEKTCCAILLTARQVCGFPRIKIELPLSNQTLPHEGYCRWLRGTVMICTKRFSFCTVDPSSISLLSRFTYIKKHVFIEPVCSSTHNDSVSFMVPRDNPIARLHGDSDR